MEQYLNHPLVIAVAIAAIAMLGGIYYEYRKHVKSAQDAAESLSTAVRMGLPPMRAPATVADISSIKAKLDDVAKTVSDKLNTHVAVQEVKVGIAALHDHMSAVHDAVKSLAVKPDAGKIEAPKRDELKPLEAPKSQEQKIAEAKPAAPVAATVQ